MRNLVRGDRENCFTAGWKSLRKAACIFGMLVALSALQMSVQTARLCDLFPDSVDASVRVRLGFSHPWELPYGERLVLSYLAQGSDSILEIGTFRGTTTALIAESNPYSIVYTVDLPDAELPDWRRAIAGEAFRDGQFGDRIVFHRANPRKLRYDFLGNGIDNGADLVFINGGHSDYEDVVHDTALAFGVLRGGGIVVWNNYQPGCPGVVQYIDEFALEQPSIRQIETTCLVVYRHVVVPSVVATPR